MDYDDILQMPPFGICGEKKRNVYLSYMKKLIKYHMMHCAEYKKICAVLGKDEEMDRLEEMPMLPVGLFKEMELKSIPEEKVFKKMMSSGTTGQKPSVIYLDSITASAQQKTLAKIMADFIGEKRLPMLIIDSPAVLKDRKSFSARGAGILGFSMFGRERIYALDDKMQPDFPVIDKFLRKYQGETVLLFGFTYMIWKYFFEKLREKDRRLPLEKGILIHGGGWKKLQKQAVSNERFKEEAKVLCGIHRVHNYYGMVEQTGSIYVECECGYLHASSYSEVLVRRIKDFSLCNVGEEGVIQVISPAAESYPGHSVLTEDMGRILGEDTCPCGRKGKFFEITGRIPSAEIRGCSDTYEG